MGGSLNQSSTTGATPSHGNTTQTYNPSAPQSHQHSASPAPIQHPHQFTQQASNTYTQPQHPSLGASHLNHYSTPSNRYVPPPNPRLPGAHVSGQKSQEVWHLPDNANLAIPEEVRSQFQQDAQGHVLFWTAPPGDTMPPVKQGSTIGHTARYLADKIRARRAAREKRKAEGLPEVEEDRSEPTTKRIKNETEKVDPQQLDDLTVKALQTWTAQMQAGTDNIYKKLYGNHWEEGKKYELEKLAAKQAETQREQAEREAAKPPAMSYWQKAHAEWAYPKVYKDDYDPRY